jgi:hypothetical protein
MLTSRCPPTCRPGSRIFVRGWWQKALPRSSSGKISRPPLTTISVVNPLGSTRSSCPPLFGGQYDRKHRRKATIELAGIVSQRLRYIELLLRHTWSIDFESDGSATQIQIPNPVGFLAQKVLIHEKREREHRAKDILYMHDTLEVFGSRLPEMRDLWRCTVSPQLLPRSTNKLSKAAENLFGELSDDVRRAAEISAERALSPREIREACRYAGLPIIRM